MDNNHMKLVHDIKDLYERVLNYKYHDFHDNGLPAPKMELVAVLQALITNTKNGEYDN